MEAKKFVRQPASRLVVEAEHAGRRLDNFLIGRFSTVPKSRIYQMIRKGEVRINKGRIKQDYRLRAGDQIRLPPIAHGEGSGTVSAPPSYLSERIVASIIHEDSDMLVLNKPANIAVHGGSAIQYGVIEVLRALRPRARFLELVHRLDRATSGCLLIAKDHQLLRGMHDLLRTGAVKKTYLALLKGRLGAGTRRVDASLDTLGTGMRKVAVDEAGKHALTEFHLLRHFKDASLARVELMTGRTHQIRVHAAHIDHPLAGDDKYGDWTFNRSMKQAGLKRLFLHAESLSFVQPTTGKKITVTAELPDELQRFLEGLS